MLSDIHKQCHLCHFVIRTECAMTEKHKNLIKFLLFLLNYFSRFNLVELKPQIYKKISIIKMMCWNTTNETLRHWHLCWMLKCYMLFFHYFNIIALFRFRVQYLTIQSHYIFSMYLNTIWNIGYFRHPWMEYFKEIPL